MKPLVSIACVTFNQEKYIREAIEGFLMQKTNFTYEILIHDDASTDGTAQIIKEYELKYPNLIHPIYQIENQFSKGIRTIFATYVFPKCQGKYIALCEGDDYWLDPYKLQKQVDFMESNPDYAICFHPINVIYQNKEAPNSIENKKTADELSIAELLKQNFISINSVMYRKQDYKDFPLDIYPGDWYLNLFHAQFGKIGYIDQVMSVYRRHSGGIWWGNFCSNYRKHPGKVSRDNDCSNDKMLVKYGLSNFAMYLQTLKIFGIKDEYRQIIFGNIVSILTAFVDIDQKSNTKLFTSALELISEDSLMPLLNSSFNEIITLNVQLNNVLCSRKWRLVKNIDASVPTLIKSLLFPVGRVIWSSIRNVRSLFHELVPAYYRRK